MQARRQTHLDLEEREFDKHTSNEKQGNKLVYMIFFSFYHIVMPCINLFKIASIIIDILPHHYYLIRIWPILMFPISKLCLFVPACSIDRPHILMRSNAVCVIYVTLSLGLISSVSVESPIILYGLADADRLRDHYTCCFVTGHALLI